MSKKKTFKTNKIFGENLKRARLLRNISQEKFAELIEIERANLSNIERGLNAPSQETLEKIIKILNIKPYILYISNEKEIDIDDAHKKLIEVLEKLKSNEKLFHIAYDFILELSRGI